MSSTPTTTKRRIRTLPSSSSSSPSTSTTHTPTASQLTQSFKSVKQSSSQSKQPSTFSLLPPPSQPRSSSSSSSLSRSSTPKPSPRSPPGVPRPPTSSRSQKSLAPDHSTCPPSLLRSLSSTPWSTLDPQNTYLLNSSRLFQLSTIELGEITNQQNKGKKPKYGQGSKLILDRLERERKERLGVQKVEKKREGEEGLPSWAKDERGEVESQLIKRLGKRLARLPSTTTTTTLTTTKGRGKGIGEDFIPLLWASDLNPPSTSTSASSTRTEKGVRKITGRNGEDVGALNDVWIVGKEFPCKRVVVVGWVLEKEWKDREGGWLYTIDDGTALLQVICPSTEPGTSNHSRVSDPTSATCIIPQLSPPSLIPKVYLSTAHSRSTIDPSSLPSQPKKSKRPFSALSEDAPPVSSTLSFEPDTLIRVVGTITPPLYSFHSLSLRITADRIEPISINEEMKHHSLVSKLWDQVYGEKVEVRKMLDRIEREEREEREMMKGLTSSARSDSSFGSFSGCWSEASSASNSTTRYRPTRPSKLLPQDLTLDNFMIYIRHHILKEYITTTSSLPPPSSQSSSHSYSFDSDTVQREEYCTPFSIEKLKSHKHLSLFAKRMSLEWIQREKERKVESRKKRSRTSRGDLSLLNDSTNSQEDERGRGIWVGDKMEEVRGAIKRDRKKVEQGSSRLLSSKSGLNMLPPPMSSSSKSERDQRMKEREDLKKFEEEVGERKLEKEIERCWEEAVRGLRKNGMIVEYVDHTRIEEDESTHEGKEERDENDWIDEQQRRQAEKVLRSMGVETLPDEPNHSKSREEKEKETTPTRFGTKNKKKRVGESKDDTPRASHSHSSRPPLTNPRSNSSSSPQQYQLVTPISLVPLIISQIQELTQYRRSSESQNVTELEIRLAMFKDSQWSAVAEYGEVVTRALECAERWGLIEGSGRGWRMIHGQ